MIEFIVNYYGTAHRAVKLAWPEVTKILGRNHMKVPHDDALLMDWLNNHHPPKWIKDAKPWRRLTCWVALGPEIKRKNRNTRGE